MSEQKQLSLEELGKMHANNALAFLDSVKMSAIGQENKRRLQAYVETVSFIEALAAGEIVVAEKQAEEVPE